MSQTTLYASVLAKIGAERSQLLSESKVKTLTQTKSLGEFVALLQDTSYKQQIGKSSPPINNRKLERAFRENKIQSFIKIVKNSPQTSADFLQMQLIKIEVENIKALVKATVGKLNRQQKLDRIYLSAESFLRRRAVFEEAAGYADVKQVVAVFSGTQWSSALKLGLASYEENGSIACLDVLLDKAYYEKTYEAYQALPRKDRAYAYFYIRMDIDGYVLLTILRAKNLNYDANWLRLALPQKRFKISQKVAEEMVSAEDFNIALKIAQQTEYGKLLVAIKIPEEAIANAELAFKRAVFRHAKGARLTDLFNVGAPLAFMVQKSVEVNNLLIAGLGVEAAMKPEEMQQKMLF